MGNSLSKNRRCGICYFELPKDSGDADDPVHRRYQWTDTDRVRHRECSEPLDTRLPYTLADLRDKRAIVRTTTTWFGFAASVARGCLGCVALERLLLAAARDDGVRLEGRAPGEEIVFEWASGLVRVNSWGNRNKDGLLCVRLAVDAAGRARRPAYESAVPGPSELASLPWSFKFDLDYHGPRELAGHHHPYAYWPPMTFGDTGSDATIVRIVQWIQDCDKNHAVCQRPRGRLPCRVLQLSAASSSTELTVRLVENASDVEDNYICLSHRWGPSTPNYRTLKENLSRQKESITWGSLPKTFQDAALVTFRLGISYLWIDSLCIIQDDAEDWRVQAAQMCDIYQGAFLTVAASCSSDSVEGLFRTSPQADIPAQESDHGSCTIRRIPEHPTWDEEGVFQMSQELPILSRAWVYQERLLSRRFVHFARYEVFFECSEGKEGLCECQNAPGGTWNGSSGAGAGSGDKTNMRKNNHAVALQEADMIAIKRYWHQIIQEYSGYDISFASDRLPALAGIARQYGTAHPRLGRYLAGMWETTLLPDLMWFCPQKSLQPRPKNVSFPSWSWISVGHYVHLNTACSQVRPGYLEVTTIQVEPTGVDKYGSINESTLGLMGYMAEGVLVLIEKYDNVFTGFQARAGGGPLIFSQDYRLIEDGSGRLDLETQLFCLKTGFVFGGNHLCLVLRKRKDGSFERVGMINRKATREWLDAAFANLPVKQTFKLV